MLFYVQKGSTLTYSVSRTQEAVMRMLTFTAATITSITGTKLGLGDDIKYNAAAAEVVAKHGIVVDDLHALTATFGPELFAGPGNVHFTQVGSAKLAAQVAETIRANFPAAKNQE